MAGQGSSFLNHRKSLWDGNMYLPDTEEIESDQVQ
jgi:hypothetical protein